MKRRVAQLQESSKGDYDPEEKGEVTAVGEHHGGSFGTYFAHKVTKLRQQHQPLLSEDSNKQIFKGCIMYVNGLTELPIEELRRLISAHGGEHIMYRAVKITHYVCNHFTDAQLKHENAKVKLNARNKVYSVTVAWVLQSISQMKRLNENLFVPKGLKDYGSMLATPFVVKPTTSSSNSNASTSSSSVQRVNIFSSSNIDRTDTSDLPRSEEVELTISQEAFLEQIPAEFRHDALQQIASVNATKIVRVGSSSGSGCRYSPEDTSGRESSRAAIAVDLCTEDRVATPTAEPISSIENEATKHRRDSLHAMIDSIHYTDENTRCSSKAVLYRIKEYVHSLLTSALDSPHGPSATAHMAVQLLTDYANYLKSIAQYEQVAFLLAELRRQCVAADNAQAANMDVDKRCAGIQWSVVFDAVHSNVKL